MLLNEYEWQVGYEWSQFSKISELLFEVKVINSQLLKLLAHENGISSKLYNIA